MKHRTYALAAAAVMFAAPAFAQQSAPKSKVLINGNLHPQHERSLS